MATVGKDELRFTMDLDGYVCDDDENVIAQFAGYSYIASDAPGLLSRIIHDYALRFTGKRCYLTLTNKHMIYRIEGEQDKIVDLSLSREYKRVFNSITFDNKRFLSFTVQASLSLSLIYLTARKYFYYMKIKYTQNMKIIIFYV